MNDSQPSAMRAVWIIARLTLRRRLNMFQAVRASPQVQGEEPKRSGTAPRSSARSPARGILLAILLSFFFFGTFCMAFAGLANLSASSRESTGKILVRPKTYERLELALRGLWIAEHFSNPAERAYYEQEWDRFLDQVFSYEVSNRPLIERDETISSAEMNRVFRQKALEGFAADRAGNLGSLPTWPLEQGATSVFARSVGMILSLWAVILVVLPLGMGNKDLGQVEWNLEWLYTFPAPARVLFASKLLEYSFSGTALLLLSPYFFLVFVAAGSGFFAAIFLGLASTLYVGILAGSIVLVTEIGLRKFLSLSQMKNLQASCTIFVTAALFLYIATIAKPVADFFVNHVREIPSFLIWNPFSLPLLIAIPGTPPAQLRLDGLAMVALPLIVGLSALYATDLLTRNGLVSAGGPYQGRREGSRSVSRSSWLRGVAAHEIALLRRDKNLLAQVVLVPLFLPAFYILINLKILSVIMNNFRYAAVMAFAVAAYSYRTSAALMLGREKKTLWYLLSLPRSLSSILLQKTQVWVVVGLLIGGGTLAVLVHLSGHMRLSLGPGLLALYGVMLFGFIAAALGILSTDLQRASYQAHMGIGASYLYMTLAGMYAVTFFGSSIWINAGQLIFCTLIAVALWQKVTDACPYLLDPAELPPRRINLADGVIAAFALAGVQALIELLLKYGSSLSQPERLTASYTIAGVIVASVTLDVLWMQGVTDLWQTLGLDFRSRETPLSLKRYATGSVSLGLAAALGAMAYTGIMAAVPEWRNWGHEEALKSLAVVAEHSWWGWAGFIVVAPPVEEFIFRGLVFQGLRRIAGPMLAICGSAALFALLHPPIAVIPVFGLGIATAISFEWSGILWAPIITHAIYNTCVLLLSKS
jgi:membrane protease YdiL (CAAX protease family)